MQIYLIAACVYTGSTTYTGAYYILLFVVYIFAGGCYTERMCWVDDVEFIGGTIGPWP